MTVAVVASRVFVAAGAVLGLGLTLLLSHVPAIGRQRLAERVAPFLASGSADRRVGPAGEGPARALASLAGDLGERLAALAGRGDEVAARLYRIHSPLSLASFRLRQLGWAVAAFLAGAGIGGATGLPPVVGLMAAPACALASYALTEAALVRACRRFEERRTLELPVVAEQLAMLVSAGYSLGSALARIGQRGSGACARDIRRVHQRVRQGVPELQALREWSAGAASPAVDRLVAVLVLSAETGDIGRLLAEEARSIRRAVQRGTVEVMDRRSQQVWVPVTVAALVPGVIFLAVPFVSALRLFATG